MNRLREFLESLLNKGIEDNEQVNLTSAQIARFLMWAEKNNISLDLNQIRNGFNLASLDLSISNSSEKNFQKYRVESTNKNRIFGLGNDIQLVAELFPNEESLDSLQLDKIFTRYEITYAMTTKDPKVTLAGLYSLKESLIKAGAAYATYLDLEITHNNLGSPIFYGYLVTISHSGEYAASVALRIS